MTTDLYPAVATVCARCAMQGEPIETCRDHRCPIRWQREAAEDRARRDARDAERRSEQAAGDPSACDLADCAGLSNTIETCAARACPFTPERRQTP